jgi:dolichyl-diphosphooligosaccharide--protein glycosyltransferase
MPAFVLGAAEVVGALGGLALVFVVLPSYAETLSRRLDFLLFRTGPAETQSIFAGGPSGFFLGPILELGFAWVLALPMLAMASWRAYRRGRSTWLLVCTYGWYFLVLAALQRRFVGELAPFFAVLAGYAFVVLLAKLDVTELSAFSRDGEIPGRDGRGSQKLLARDGGESTDRSLSLPDRSTISAIAILLLFVTSAGAVQTGVRHEQVKISDDNFRAAAWMDGYAEERGWEYPENYVLSKWGRNRMFNYFVNGEARGYGFARQNYETFLASQDPASEYRRLNDRVGFVVTKDLSQNAPPDLTYARLHHRFGSAGSGENAPGVGHYRAVYASDDGSVKVFTLVPGANVTGTAAPNETVTVSTQVEIEGGEFEYTRRVETGADGNFSVTVAHPGTYEVGNQTVTVGEDAVQNGGNVTVGA